ncbi:MAG: hypothetical protein PHF97_06575 [Bacteroidales bacterium]|nr:hypothetical protein [Bacteroidales bacterium]MDD4603455.1 hypothetical protein [Bacteroidales bacterium]
MEENTQPLLPESKPKRSNLLTVLCILTFIGSGMNMFSSFVISAFYETFIQVLQEIAEKFNLPGMDVFLEAKPLFFFISGILYAGSVAGAVLMFQLRKVGFHVYTIFQILLVIAPMYFMHLSGPNISDLIFSGTFIILYSIHLKIMI